MILAGVAVPLSLLRIVVRPHLERNRPWLRIIRCLLGYFILQQQLLVLGLDVAVSVDLLLRIENNLLVF